MHKINHANIKEWAKNYDGPLFDGILCDPPYELGFMGKSWDSSGIAFDTEMWADLYRHIKPGAHLLAFSGSRTYHRMAVAIEDAGFEIRDQLIWMYGSGFPKSLNIGKAVDKIQGNEREVTGIAKRTGKEAGTYGAMAGNNTETKGTSEWEGYGTALKPAHEPCVLARKPIEGTVANNVLKHGTGGLNIDGTRVGTEQTITRGRSSGGTYDIGLNNPDFTQTNTGRFPANLIHDGSDEVEAVFPQTGKTSMPGTVIRRKKFTGSDRLGQLKNAPINGEPEVAYGDSGSASRYFYTAKASKSERNAGLEGFEEKLTPKMDGGEFINPMTGVSSKQTMRQNHHPTVKPLTLTKYLATLIKPPTGGRLLVPFSGSGSEIIGALQAGWEYVEGVELTEEYIPIAEARIKYWTNISHTSSKPKVSAKNAEPVQHQAESLTLF